MTEQDKPSKQSLPPVEMVELIGAANAMLAFLDSRNSDTDFDSDAELASAHANLFIAINSANEALAAMEPAKVDAFKNTDNLNTSGERVQTLDEQILYALDEKAVTLKPENDDGYTSGKRVVTIGEAYDIIHPYLSPAQAPVPVEPNQFRQATKMVGVDRIIERLKGMREEATKDVLNKPDNLNTSGEHTQTLNETKCDHWWRRMGERMICEDCGYEEDDLAST